MNITKDTYRKIEEYMSGASEVEYGGYIAKGFSCKIICDFVPDASGSGKSRFYPNKDILLNSVKRWNKDSLVFCGIIHSHPKNGSCRLSVADENYAAKFLELNPDFKDVYFPIFFMGNLYVYSVSRSERAEILICEEDLIVVEDQQI